MNIFLYKNYIKTQNKMNTTTNPNYMNSIFVIECRYGNLEKVKECLKNGVDIHFNEDAGLRLASENGHLEVVKLLLDNGADIHTGNDEALFHTCREGYYEMVKLLIERGADIYTNQPIGYCGLNVLELAIYHRHEKIVELLTQYGLKESV